MGQASKRKANKVARAILAWLEPKGFLHRARSMKGYRSSHWIGSFFFPAMLDGKIITSREERRLLWLSRQPPMKHVRTEKVAAILGMVEVISPGAVGEALSGRVMGGMTLPKMPRFK